ncbi:hypothetical protein FOA52_016181 [Chlamydomonas sp. UWO 241]|nr:hypothetical protein FOA52_016181 [Chlamydomonas sp. UWO 241]
MCNTTLSLRGGVVSASFLNAKPAVGGIGVEPRAGGVLRVLFSVASDAVADVVVRNRCCLSGVDPSAAVFDVLSDREEAQHQALWPAFAAAKAAGKPAQFHRVRLVVDGEVLLPGRSLVRRVAASGQGDSGIIIGKPGKPEPVPYSSDDLPPPPETPKPSSHELTQEALRASVGSQSNLSFVAFWLQLALTLVSAGVLLFSVFVASTSGPTDGLSAVDISKFFTLGGVITSFVSTFVANGFQNMARKLRSGGVYDIAWAAKTLIFTSTLNLVGIALTTVGLQASVGTLVGKTLLTAASNPYQAGAQGNALVSVDVFALQASTNILLAHLIGLAFVNIMQRILSKATRTA